MLEHDMIGAAPLLSWTAIERPRTDDEIGRTQMHQ